MSTQATRSDIARFGKVGEARPTQDDTGLRVLCVDDHALLVEGLRAQFALDGGMRVVGSLSSATDLLKEVSKINPDVVLLDIEMPGPDVFEVADRLRHMFPHLRFAFLSAHIRDGYLTSAYKSGAWGYFSKSDELEDIVAGIKDIARSKNSTFIMGPKVRQRCSFTATTSPTSRNPRNQVASADEHRPATPLDSLSSREVEVLRLIGKGQSRNEIARELSRSAKTIDGHQDRLMKKLAINSRSDLMRFAIREGFAEA